MKKKKIFIIGLVLIILLTGCGKKEGTNKKGEVSYSCYQEDENSDGGTSISKQVVVLNKEKHFVTYKIINDDIFKTEEMYKETKERVESNVKEHNEKYADQYKWELETNDKEMHIVSTRIYDMSNITSGEGHKYETEYQFFNEDGTYNVDGWMDEKTKNKSTCKKD